VGAAHLVECVLRLVRFTRTFLLKRF